jgi:glycyl-radical enzyme activating protein
MNRIDRQGTTPVTKGWVFNIQRYSIQDGPGIRTTVFLNGCPLRCLWCSNPESQGAPPSLFYFDSLCVRCYRCVEACPTGATSIAPDGSIKIDRTRCERCGKCAEVCPNEARVMSGKLMTVDEVLEVVKKDALFYKNSGGGITASGGEPTHQPEFLLEFFKGCQNSGFHTCLDTTGYVRWEIFEGILEYTDLVLYDIKHMNPERHKELTGVDNRIILLNAEKIAKKGIPLIIRVPLIPGGNDSPENLETLGKYVAKLGTHKLDLLPYHQFGVKKYERLGMEYKMGDIKPYQKEQVELIKKTLESYGLEVSIV